MNHVIVDLEATCWEQRVPVAEMEIIEIGAVLVVPPSYQPVSDFDTFVRPTRNPLLSPFCRLLTHIRQRQVEAAPAFPGALDRLLAWVGAAPFRMCSWGDFDRELLTVECERHGRSWPEHYAGHVNLKHLYARAFGTKPSIGLREAMRQRGLVFEGRLHRGVDDARNILRLAQTILVLDQ